MEKYSPIYLLVNEKQKSIYYNAYTDDSERAVCDFPARNDNDY
jgi:hypothetical protein